MLSTAVPLSRRACGGAGRAGSAPLVVAQLGGSFGHPHGRGPVPNGRQDRTERDLSLNALQMQAPPAGRAPAHEPAGYQPPLVDHSLQRKRKELDLAWELDTAEPAVGLEAAAASPEAAAAPPEVAPRAVAEAADARSASHGEASSSSSSSSSVEGVVFGTTRRRGELRRRPTAACSAGVRRRLAARRTADVSPAGAADAALAGASGAGRPLEPLSEAARDAAYVAALRDQLRRARRRRAGAQSDSVAMFLTSLGNTCVLSREQELELCRILQRGVGLERAAARLQRSLGRLPTLDEVAAAGGLASAAEARLVARSRAEAEDLMVQHNMRLVFSVCKRYLSRGVELADLLMDGVEGMRRALLRFDPQKGFKFSTYSHWWIRQAEVAVSDDVWDVEAGGADEGGAELDASVVESLRFAFDLVIATLPKRERNIMRLYMGLVPLEPPAATAAAAAAGGAAPAGAPAGAAGAAAVGAAGALYAPPKTLSELAEMHGLGKERIRQIYDKALVALRRPWRQQLLRELLGLPQTPLPVERCGAEGGGGAAPPAAPRRLLAEALE
eukprot:scaffold2.g7133.t1